MNNFYKILDKLEEVPRHIFWRYYLGFWAALLLAVCVFGIIKMW